MSEYLVISPLSENFTCRASGNCCTTPWKVKVGPRKADNLASSQTVSELKRQGYTPLPVTEGESRTARREDGSCVFHREDGCDIHRELGGPAKPTVCQLYPFHLVNTPDGHYLSLAFSCPSVVRGGGLPVSEQIPQIVQTLRESEYYEPGALSPDTRVNLIARETISWSEYLQQEAPILEQLLTHGVAKGCLSVAASLLDYHLGRVPKWDPSTHSGESLLSIAQQLPLFSAYAVAVLEARGDEARQESVCQDLLEDRRVSSILLNRELPSFELFPPKDEATQELLSRFARHMVYGKRLLEGGSLISRLLGTAISAAVFHFYHHAGGSTAWCFSLIETALLGHSDKASSLFRLYERRLLGLLQNEVET